MPRPATCPQTDGIGFNTAFGMHFTSASKESRLLSVLLALLAGVCQQRFVFIDKSVLSDVH